MDRDITYHTIDIDAFNDQSWVHGVAVMLTIEKALGSIADGPLADTHLDMCRTLGGGC